MCHRVQNNANTTSSLGEFENVASRNSYAVQYDNGKQLKVGLYKKQSRCARSTTKHTTLLLRSKFVAHGYEPL